VINPAPFIRLRFKDGGREPPFVDCWGLYRHVVATASGVDLAEHAGVTQPLAQARTLGAERERGEWLEIAVGAERPCDLVLMKGMVGKGRGTAMRPLHVGCVIGPGKMIDIEESNGVMVRLFRDLPTAAANPTVRHRVLGIYRPKALA
jgi:cell wall-associated NlpC family hydrolase